MCIAYVANLRRELSQPPGMRVLKISRFLTIVGELLEPVPASKIICNGGAIHDTSAGNACLAARVSVHQVQEDVRQEMRRQEKGHETGFQLHRKGSGVHEGRALESMVRPSRCVVQHAHLRLAPCGWRAHARVGW